MSMSGYEQVQNQGIKKICPIMFAALAINITTHGNRRVQETGYGSAECAGPHCQLWIEYKNGHTRCGLVTQDIIGMEQL